MDYVTILLAAAKSAGVPGSLFLAICTHESRLHNIVVPHDGGSASYSLCQIKEGTARGLGYKGIATGPLKSSKKCRGCLEPKGKPQGLMVPEVGAKYAALYLKEKLDQYDWNLCKSTAAYNSGTYRPSEKLPGKPKNFKYIKSVTLNLDEKNRDFLVCGSREVEDE